MNRFHHSSAIYRTATSAALVLFSQAALAWGPHTEIAQAALTALGTGDGIYKQLGADTGVLAQYVWMADWRTQLLIRTDEVFYADDYLLFPKAKTHSQHICPEVKQTYAPFFRRALQALRTESPRNAARWIGSLLHFTTDTGSPPHAAGFLGAAHSKMENWVDAKLIHLPEYQPQLLGEDDSAAEAGFLARMDGLIEFSKERAARCRADVDADRREPVEPVVLESALETARVTADLLHTLGVLAARPASGASLSGTVALQKNNHPSLDRLPAKVVLLGTDFSTLTAPDGSFAFRHLPEGDYKLVALAPGATSAPMAVSLRSGGFIVPQLALSAAASGKPPAKRRFSAAMEWRRCTGSLVDENSPRKAGGQDLGTRLGRRMAPLGKGRLLQAGSALEKERSPSGKPPCVCASQAGSQRTGRAHRNRAAQRSKRPHHIERHAGGRLGPGLHPRGAGSAGGA